jgi:peptidoglycan/xylan/chitin deacetylase (PgdA/CDA1 family)
MRSISIMTAMIAILVVVAVSRTAVATSVNNISPEAKVSFTFDDGLASTVDRAAPILAKYGFVGTSYVITDCVGSGGTCRAKEDAAYMDWQDIKRLQDEYGWGIGSHTTDHPSLTSLSKEEQTTRLKQSRETLAEHGFDATDFASPYGDYNRDTLAISAKFYESHRGFWDIGMNKWPYNDRLLSVQQLQSGVTVPKVKQLVDAAIKNKQWLVFVLHDIKDTPSSDPDDFEYASSDFDQVAAYIKQQGVPVTTIGQGLVKSNVNLLPDDSFDKGLAGGWTTDHPKQVKHDTGNNGSYPSPRSSLQLTAGSKTVHLFSPKIDIDPERQYMIKSFLHVTTIASGEVGYYIDEYDSKGKWVSGRWRQHETAAFAENINLPYKPSSEHVRKARLQVYVTAGSGIKAFVDNFQWFPMEQK